jgi:hypothetical protein
LGKQAYTLLKTTQKMGCKISGATVAKIHSRQIEVENET